MTMMSRGLGFLLVVSCLSGCMSPTAQLEEGKKAFYYQHYDQSFKLLLPLAQKGNVEAQYAVGYSYYYGKGVIEDQEKGQYWINKSASQGNPLAIRALEIEATHTPPKA
jgi:TPR repeat protein